MCSFGRQNLSVTLSEGQRESLAGVCAWLVPHLSAVFFKSFFLFHVTQEMHLEHCKKRSSMQIRFGTDFAVYHKSY